MCLAVPMKVTSVEGNLAQVEIGGTTRTVGLDILDQQPKIGEYVIVHAGFAINVIDEQEAAVILDDFKELFADDV